MKYAILVKFIIDSEQDWEDQPKYSQPDRSMTKSDLRRMYYDLESAVGHEMDEPADEMIETMELLWYGPENEAPEVKK